jgi:hypothetical protein
VLLVLCDMTQDILFNLPLEILLEITKHMHIDEIIKMGQCNRIYQSFFICVLTKRIEKHLETYGLSQLQMPLLEQMLLYDMLRCISTSSFVRFKFVSNNRRKVITKNIVIANDTAVSLRYTLPGQIKVDRLIEVILDSQIDGHKMRKNPYHGDWPIPYLRRDGGIYATIRTLSTIQEHTVARQGWKSYVDEQAPLIWTDVELSVVSFLKN